MGAGLWGWTISRASRWAEPLFWQGVLVSATNPKTLFFYAAFFPQFIDPASPPGPQLALLGVSFLVVATVLDGTYAVLAGQLRPWLRDQSGHACAIASPARA